jgi:hypothetical protein
MNRGRAGQRHLHHQWARDEHRRPYEGVKGSGYRRERSVEGISEFHGCRTINDPRGKPVGTA